MASEAARLAKNIRTLLELNGWFVWRGGSVRLRAGQIIGSVGAPDLNCVKDGRYMGVEIKYGKDRKSPEQIGFHEMLRAKGCLVVVARGIKDVEQAIDALAVTTDTQKGQS
jgi:hypothetical protein